MTVVAVIVVAAGESRSQDQCKRSEVSEAGTREPGTETAHIMKSF
jgi:hypothetical protein